MDNPIGVVSCHVRYQALVEVFEQAAGWGMGTVEWFEGDRPGVTEPETVGKIVALSREYGIGATYHAPWQGAWDLGQQKPADCKRTVAELLGRAARLQAGLMTLHLGSVAAGSDRRGTLDKIAAALSACASTAEAAGVRVCLENFTRCYDPADLGDRTDDFAQVLSAVDSPAVGLNLDIGHAHITGNTAELLSAFGPRLYNTHLHDTDGRSDGHLPPGEGTVDFAAVLAALKRAGYAGPLNFEFGQAGDAYQRLVQLIRRA